MVSGKFFIFVSLKSNVFILVKFPIHSGIEIKVILANNSFSNFVKFLMHYGKLFSLFFDKSRYFREVNYLKLSGKSDNLFLSDSSLLRSLRAPKLFGSVLSWLFLILRVFNFSKVQSSSGSPSNLLSLKLSSFIFLNLSILSTLSIWLRPKLKKRYTKL